MKKYPNINDARTNFDLQSLLRAKTNYERVLKINPKNDSARKKLRKLRHFVNKRMTEVRVYPDEDKKSIKSSAAILKR